MTDDILYAVALIAELTFIKDDRQHPVCRGPYRGTHPYMRIKDCALLLMQAASRAALG